MSHHGSFVRIAMWGDGRFRPWVLTLLGIVATAATLAIGYATSSGGAGAASLFGYGAAIFLWVEGSLLVGGALHAFLLRRTVIIAGPQGWSITAYSLFVPIRRCSGRFPFQSVDDHEDTYTYLHKNSTGVTTSVSRTRRIGVEVVWNQDAGASGRIRLGHGLKRHASLKKWLRILSRSGGTEVEADGFRRVAIGGTVPAM